MSSAEWFWLGFSVSNFVWHVIFRWIRIRKRESDMRVQANLELLNRTVLKIKRDRDALLEACRLASKMECGCFNALDPDWHSDRCPIQILKKAIAEAERE